MLGLYEIHDKSWVTDSYLRSFTRLPGPERAPESTYRSLEDDTIC